MDPFEVKEKELVEENIVTTAFNDINKDSINMPEQNVCSSDTVPKSVEENGKSFELAVLESALEDVPITSQTVSPKDHASDQDGEKLEKLVGPSDNVE